MSVAAELLGSGRVLLTDRRSRLVAVVEVDGSLLHGMEGAYRAWVAEGGACTVDCDTREVHGGVWCPVHRCWAGGGVYDVWLRAHERAQVESLRGAVASAVEARRDWACVHSPEGRLWADVAANGRYWALVDAEADRVADEQAGEAGGGAR